MMETSASANAFGTNPFRKILVGLDNSDQTDLVIRVSSFFTSILGATAEVVTVINVPTNSAGNEMDGLPANQDEIRLRDALIERMHKVYGDRAKGMEVKVLHGDPAERISEYANYAHCDLILVGSRAQGAFRKALLGSVSGSVAAKSKVSVLIVK